MNLKKVIDEWKWTILGLSAVILLGFAIRIINLTILPIFVDEAIYVRWAQVMAAEPTLRFLPLSDGKQPLYMWVLMFVIKYFNDPLFIGRLISVITGIGTSLGVFTFSCILFKNKQSLASDNTGKSVSFLSSFIYLISPFTFFFDRMALVDSMLSMFIIWTATIGYLAIKDQRLDLSLIAGFLLGFASLTKSSALFAIILLPTFLIFVKKVKLFKSIALIFVSYIVVFVMYNIQRLGPNFSLLSSRTGDYVLPINHVWTNFFDPLLPHLKDYFVWLISMGPITIIPIVVIGIYLGLTKHFKETVVLLLWAFIPVIVQAELGVTFTARYVLFTIPFLVILAGLIATTNMKWVKTISLILIVLFCLQSIRFDFFLLTNPEKANLPRGERSGYLEEWTAGQGIKEISEYLKTVAADLPAGGQVVVGTEGYFGTLPDGLQLYVNDKPKIIVIGVGVIIENTPKSLEESFKAGNKTYLVVNKSRFKGDSEKLKYKLVAKYPKGLRLTDSDQYARFGPQEELLFFELTK